MYFDWNNEPNNTTERQVYINRPEVIIAFAVLEGETTL